MNLLARILSHGFALAVVVLIAIALMYRGDLFPEWDLPEFLVIEEKSDTGTDVKTPATVVSTLPESATIADDPAAAPQVEVITDVVTEEVMSPAAEADVTGEAPGASSKPVVGDDAPDSGAALEEPVNVVPDLSQETGNAAGIATSSREQPEPDVSVTRSRYAQGADEDMQAVTSVAATESATVTEQSEVPVAAVITSIPLAEPVTEPEPVLAAEESPVVPSATPAQSEALTEQPESPAPAIILSTPPTEPVTEPEPVHAAEEALVVPSATPAQSEALTEQPESPAPAIITSTPPTGPVTESESAADVPAVATITAEQGVAELPESTVPDVTPPAVTAEQTADSEPEPTATAPAPVLESNTGKSAYESLAAAREAYWLHDYEGAENHYRTLIQLEPDNPDWYGELANMYFAQGQWEQAASAYYESGVRLLKDGMVEQARQMVNVIRGLNGPGADDLETQINAVDKLTR